MRYRGWSAIARYHEYFVRWSKKDASVFPLCGIYRTRIHPIGACRRLAAVARHSTSHSGFASWSGGYENTRNGKGAPRAGFEPATPALGGRCSIRLSYRGMRRMVRHRPELLTRIGRTAGIGALASTSCKGHSKWMRVSEAGAEGLRGAQGGEAARRGRRSRRRCRGPSRRRRLRRGGAASGRSRP